MKYICKTCGNPFDPSATQPFGTCPFCSSQETALQVPSNHFSVKTINLEKGLPTVEEAISRFQSEISMSRVAGVRVIKLIHGYGSTGKGGALKKAMLLYLARLKKTREIRDYIPGEEFSSHHPLIRKYPPLRKDPDCNRANPGITLIDL